ncbi:unnamed protein product [Linum tenue]|uniref:Pectinesterase n=2 Tax=Linum tenue TaxID=586396 RepID=A0AAV0K9P2_9ROSI|nr:unnamed protein product [Linum tenue]
MNHHHPHKPSPLTISTICFSVSVLIIRTVAAAAVDDHHAVLRSACGAARFPDLCFSAVATLPAETLSSQNDVIEASINVTCSVVERNFFTVEKMIRALNPTATKRQKTALHDCLATIDQTLDELHASLRDLKQQKKKLLLTRHTANLMTWLSAAMTNQETCLDGFSHGRADRRVREGLVKGHVHVGHMCSNSLAMIANMTAAMIANMTAGKTGTGSQKAAGPAEWLSAGDRRLLQSSEDITPDVVVAADGSGDYATVGAAVAAAPSKSSKRYIIRIKAGVYKENVEVGKGKTNIMFVGDNKETTIITGSRSVGDGFTTFSSATVAVVGQGFLARDITFQNTAGPSKHQAVALRVGSDLSAFYRCNILAYQDTLYVHSNRQFFTSCLVSGTVDFIFGNAAVVLQDCDIRARRPDRAQKNMVTAQGRTDPNQNTGIVIQKSTIGAASDLQAAPKGSYPTYLGRPWKEYSRTVVMESTITDVVDPAGWFEWDGDFALDTLYYAEYRNGGAGADTSGRVDWKGYKVITDESEAAGFAPGNFVAGGSWLPGTNFPYSLGL